MTNAIQSEDVAQTIHDLIALAIYEAQREYFDLLKSNGITEDDGTITIPGDLIKKITGGKHIGYLLAKKRHKLYPDKAGDTLTIADRWTWRVLASIAQIEMDPPLLLPTVLDQEAAGPLHLDALRIASALFAWITSLYPINKGTK